MAEEKSVFDAYLTGERPTNYHTLSGLEIKETYTTEDHSPTEECPGEYPFTRGVHRGMYRDRFWTRRQQSGYGTPEESNARLLFLLEAGQTGLNVDFDVATKLSLDPDYPLAQGGVGMQGMSFATVDDMRRLFAGIPLDRVSSTLIAGAPSSAVVMAAYLIIAEERGIPAEALIGTIMNCAFTQLVGPTYQANTTFFPIEYGFKVGLDVIEYCTQRLPKWNVLNINAYNTRETGVDAVQEAAFSFALAVDYIKNLIARGLVVDSFAPRMAFFSAAQIDLFEEAAKLRAMRRIWARLLRERFGAQNPRSWWFRTAIQTAALALTAQQPLNNVVRATIQTLAAVLGGAQSIHTTCYDEAYSLPTEESHLLAIRTQQVVAYETGVTKAADPLGGSFFVETLTDELERRIVALMDEMESRGGFVTLFKEGWIEDQIQKARHRLMERQESGEDALIGVNLFRGEDEGPLPFRLFKVDPATQQRRLRDLQEFRGRRDQAAASAALRALREQVREEPARNVMPAVIAAVRADGTLGEVVDAMREALGFKPALAQQGVRK